MSSPFSGSHASSYAEGPPRQVPGFASLHLMASMLLAERTPPDGRVLVLGAGGGLELKALADRHPAWTFDGIDPSADMLRTAEETIGGHAGRVELHHGYIDVAPSGPFDAAISLLTFHFIPHEQRAGTLRQIRARLKPGAPFVLAHISFPQTEPDRANAIARHVAFAAGGVYDPGRADAFAQAIGPKLTVLAPEEEEQMLRRNGFGDVTLFYAGLSFRGWVAYAA